MPFAIKLRLRATEKKTQGQRERVRDNRSRALRGARHHTVGYIGGCDQDLGEIEYNGVALRTPPEASCCSRAALAHNPDLVDRSNVGQES